MFFLLVPLNLNCCVEYCGSIEYNDNNKSILIDKIRINLHQYTAKVAADAKNKINSIFAKEIAVNKF